MSAFSIRSQSAERRIVKIDLDLVHPSPSQPRREFDDAALDTLAESIRRFGLLSPILVRRCADDFELIAGERRYRAMQRLGWRQCEAIVLGAGDADCALMSLIENLQREDLHYLDQAEACRRILRQQSLTQEALASAIGKSPSALANLLRLLRLNEAVQQCLRRGKLSERHARALLRLKEPSRQLQLAEVAAQQQLSVRQLEDRIDQLCRSKPAPKLPEKLLKENRLVVNAVKETVRQLRRIGVQASSRVENREDSFDVIVTVHLNANAPTQ